jgi:hypothetical protein
MLFRLDCLIESIILQGSGAGPSSGIPPAVLSADRPTGIVIFPFTFMTLVYYFSKCLASYFLSSTICWTLFFVFSFITTFPVFMVRSFF